MLHLGAIDVAKSHSSCWEHALSQLRGNLPTEMVVSYQVLTFLVAVIDGLFTG